MMTSAIMARRLGSTAGRRHAPIKGILLALIATVDGFSYVNTVARERQRKLNSNIRQSTRLYSQHATITDSIRTAFEEDQTDGILKLSDLHLETDVDTLVEATLDAIDDNRGHVASILNGFIGSCMFMEDEATAASKACELLETFEQLEEEKEIRPDTVTYSLAYNVINRDPASVDLANVALQRAQRMSKKVAGTKRRKALAASRRKKVSESCKSVESDLKELLGGDFEVLHESVDAFVINKPSGISCFHKKKTTAGKVKKGKASHKSSDVSLEDALSLCGVPLSTLNPDALGLVHRLDRGTSGCMVLAKTDQAHASLVSEFFLRKCEKQYTTIVAPAPLFSTPDSGSIDMPVNGRPAKSEYHIVKRYDSTAALVNFKTHTGRKHQVRVHAATSDLASPVLNDHLYSREDRIPDLPDDVIESDNAKARFFLHASSLSIPRYEINCQASLPSWWKPLLQSIQNTSSED
ncbi:unnamed protein product [Cylindrotheca closterium]|uniref:Pseudouridine synthase RsuA/RluA-like domain-containing protein n=1 Tax=Cylindrotheca closterium TaxID=2856 RepID=A0AAD2G338_9STRA|nr:unnamed protein product [Cylindrotheca closterium]